MPSRIRQTDAACVRTQAIRCLPAARLRSRRATCLIRALAIGLLAWLTIAATAATASATGTAPVRVNTTATTWTALNSTWSILTASGVRTHICRQIILGTTITSAGSITIPNGAVRFNTCTFSGISVTWTQNQAWSGEIKHLDDVRGNPTAITVQFTNVSIHFSGAGCQFDITGSLLGSTTISAAHNVLFNMGSTTFPAPLTTNPLSLRISNISGTCSLLGIANGNLAAYAGLFAFSPAITLAAI